MLFFSLILLGVFPVTWLEAPEDRLQEGSQKRFERLAVDQQ